MCALKKEENVTLLQKYASASDECSVLSDCNPMHCCPPAPLCMEFFQARILDWAVIAYSSYSSIEEVIIFIVINIITIKKHIDLWSLSKCFCLPWNRWYNSSLFSYIVKKNFAFSLWVSFLTSSNLIFLIFKVNKKENLCVKSCCKNSMSCMWGRMCNLTCIHGPHEGT